MQPDLLLYNSLTRQKEVFEPIRPPFVGLYVCGPTVYNYAHLGNARTYVTFDILYRYLKYLGYRVRYVRNITDVGHITSEFDEGVDRIGAQAKLEQLEPMEVAHKYTVYFHWVLQQLNTEPPSIEPTATGHIIEQIDMVKKILAKDLAYEVNGSVYFDVQAYMKQYPYGELSGRNVDELLENTRELDGQDEKRFFADFALWKKAAPEHVMRWDSPWGEGFPGWHLECSAMSTKYLGDRFDIHGGGMDLKFPHHESEVAQNTACCGHGPVKYWLHGNMLTVNGQKMSKSLGNSFLPHELFEGSHELLAQGYSPMVVRFFMLQAHYRSTLDFSNEALQAAEKGYRRLMSAIAAVSKLRPSAEGSVDVSAVRKACREAMNDDLNTPVVIAHLFEAVRIVNSCSEGHQTVTESQIKELKHLFNDYALVILGLKEEASDSATGQLTDQLMSFILSLRAEARQKKDFATSDKIRDTLASLNVQIKDTKEGATWTYEQ
ncbi:MAG: cysteine--tRNA ligase [Flavobacteriales bacterium]|jgi:cysteinyl-tRNA synthetase